jgi:hypothetical protein
MGKIVLIENANPGFDGIFSRQIGVLIKKYGGANLHNVFSHIRKPYVQ